MTPRPLPEPEVRLIEQTRSSVLNLMIGTAAGVALSGLVLRSRDWGATLWPTDTTRRACYLTLLLLVLGSTVARRMLGSRASLQDPSTRASRFARSHLTGAAIGALAVPLGFVYGFAVEPRLQAVTPFWVAALALGVLSLPRSEELEGFDTALPACDDLAHTLHRDRLAVPQDGVLGPVASEDEAGR